MSLKPHYPTIGAALSDLENSMASANSRRDILTIYSNEYMKYANMKIPKAPQGSKKRKGKTSGTLRKSFINNSKPEKGIMMTKTPYARYINGGVSSSGKLLKYSEPGTTDHYLDKAYEENQQVLEVVFRKAVEKQL